MCNVSGLFRKIARMPPKKDKNEACIEMMIGL